MNLYKKISFILLFIANLLITDFSIDIRLFLHIFSLLIILYIFFFGRSDKQTTLHHTSSDKDSNISQSFPLNQVHFSDDLLDRALNILQEMMNLDGVLYFQYDSDNTTFTLKKSIVKSGSVKKGPYNKKRFPNLLIDKQSICLDSPLPDMFEYYEEIAQKRESVYAKTVLLNNKVVGCFFMDSVEQNYFSEEFISIINQVIRMFAVSIAATTKSNKKNESDILVDLYKQSLYINTQEDFIQLVSQVTSNIIQADRFFIVKQISENEVQTIHAIGSIEGSFSGHIYPIDEGIVGWSIMNRKFVHLNQLIKNNQYTIRFNQKEKRPERTGSFVFVPIINQVIIGLGFERIESDSFTEQEIERIKLFSNEVKYIFKSVLNKESLSSNSLYDASKHLLSALSFENQFSVFNTIFKRYNQYFSVFVLQVLNREQNPDTNRILFEFVAKELIAKSRPCDLFFRINRSTISAIIPVTEQKQLKIFIEKLHTHLNETQLVLNQQSVKLIVKITELNNIQKKNYEEMMTVLRSTIA